MASLRTASTINSEQGLIWVAKIATCVTGDTFSWTGPVKSWMVVNRTTTDAVTASYDTTLKLFTITVANTPDVDLWILP